MASILILKTPTRPVRVRLPRFPSVHTLISAVDWLQRHATMAKAEVSVTDMPDHASWLGVRLMRLSCLAQQEIAITWRHIAPVVGLGHVKGKEGKGVTVASMDTSADRATTDSVGEVKNARKSALA